MSPTDGQLLERFAASRDEAAFEALLSRHGPMVWGVCLRALGHHQEAEDAFQATFLVLARRAAAIRRHEAVGGWLHSVAHRLSLRVILSDKARRDREQHAIDSSGAVRGPDDLLTQVVWREIRTVLDDELNQLPKKYRAPLVLCYLEGKTHLEAAQELGWPSGSMSKRLARACELLRERLTQRGLVFSTTLLAGALTEHGASAVPPALTTSTLRAALACISGKLAGAVAPPVVALTEGVLAAMFLTKIKIAAAVLVALGLSVGLATYGAMAGGQEPIPGSVPVPKDPKPGERVPFVTPLFVDEKKDATAPFVTEVIDPQAKHTLTLPTNYGCVLLLRERPIRWEASPGKSGLLSWESIGRGKQVLVRTGAVPGTVLWHFWFDNPQAWNYQENLFTLAIRVEAAHPTAKPVDPATYKDIPLITSIIAPQGEMTINRGGTRLLILKEPLHKLQPEQSALVTLKLVAPRQLLITAVPSTGEFPWLGTEEAPKLSQVLTFWFPANPEPDQVEVINYLVHVVTDTKNKSDDEPLSERVRSDRPLRSRLATQSAPEQPPSAQSPAVADLAKTARDAANEGYRASEQGMQAGPIVPGIKAQWSQRILEAELELANEHAARLAAYEAHVKRMQDVEQMSKKHYEAGRLPLVGYSEAKFFRAEAELWLAKEKAKP